MLNFRACACQKSDGLIMISIEKKKKDDSLSASLSVQE